MIVGIEVRFLGHLTDTCFVAWQVGERIMTIDEHIAARWLEESCQDPYCRAFSGSVRT
jgi:hypothetical protein